MSILHYRVGSESAQVRTDREKDSRDALGDLKHGLDLVFELKSQIDKMHPVAAETLIRMLAH